MKPFQDSFRPYNAIQPSTLWGLSPKIKTKSYRTERDSLGEILIPSNALWSTTTQRCLEHFHFENLPFSYKSPPLLILSIVLIKKAAGYTHHKNGLLPTYKWLALQQAADEILSGQFLDDHFPLSLWQTGSLSHTHINCNEVLMNRGNQIIQESIAYCMSDLVDGDDSALYDISIDDNNFVSKSPNERQTQSIRHIIELNNGDEYVQVLKNIFTEIPPDMIDKIRQTFIDTVDVVPGGGDHKHHTHHKQDDSSHTQSHDGAQEAEISSEQFPTPPNHIPCDASCASHPSEPATARPRFHTRSASSKSKGVNAEIRENLTSVDPPIEHTIGYSITVPTIPIRVIHAPSPISCRHSGSPFDAPVKLNAPNTHIFTSTQAFRLWEKLTKISYQIVPMLKHSDEINACQSSNCVIPSAIRIASIYACDRLIHKALPDLIEAFHEKATLASEKDIIKLGRTHLQDAVALRYAEEFQSYCNQLEYWHTQLQLAVHSLFALPLGGTAVGNGCNAYTTFATEACDQIAYYTEDTLHSSKISGIAPSKYPSPSLPTPSPYRKFHSAGPSQNKMASISAVNEEVTLASALSGLASCLSKIANDIRFTSCGPRGGIQETEFTNFEAGSSIMPKKNNPTQCEQLIMVCSKVYADAQLLWLGNTGGQMQLNACRPIVCYGLLDAGILLEQSIMKFTKYAIRPLKFNTEVIAKNTNESLMLATMITPIYGYQTVSLIVKHAEEHGQTLKEALKDLGYISTDEEYDELINIEDIIQPLPIDKVLAKRKTLNQQSDAGKRHGDGKHDDEKEHDQVKKEISS